MLAHALNDWAVRPRPPLAVPTVTSHRCTAVPRLRALLESHAIAHSRFRLEIARSAAVVCDERLLARAFERKGRVERPYLTVVFEGRMRVEHGDRTHWLGPGGVALLPDRHGCLLRQEGARFLSLALEWDPGTLGGAVASAEIGLLDALDHARLRGLVDAVAAHPPGDEATVRLAQIVSVLRQAGAPLEARRPADLVEDPAPHAMTLSRALDQSLSELAKRPMIIDLERQLAVSPRHIQRLVAAYHARYGFDADGWRDALHRRRLHVATALMTAPGTSTETVAAAVGYGSPPALCRAFAEARLPSPTAVARFVHGLA